MVNYCNLWWEWIFWLITVTLGTRLCYESWSLSYGFALLSLSMPNNVCVTYTLVPCKAARCQTDTMQSLWGRETRLLSLAGCWKASWPLACDPTLNAGYRLWLPVHQLREVCLMLRSPLPHPPIRHTSAESDVRIDPALCVAQRVLCVLLWTLCIVGFLRCQAVINRLGVVSGTLLTSISFRG